MTVAQSLACSPLIVADENSSHPEASNTVPSGAARHIISEPVWTRARCRSSEAIRLWCASTLAVMSSWVATQPPPGIGS
jgi:hypothetical protein